MIARTVLYAESEILSYFPDFQMTKWPGDESLNEFLSRLFYLISYFIKGK